MEKSLFTKDRMLRYGKNTVMGIQHLFAMMGATILVPMLCNMSIAVGLIAAGVGTIIFFFITKKKVPVFLGSSFAFMGALAAQMNPQNADGVYLADIDPAWVIGGEAWNVAMAQQCIAVVCTGADSAGARELLNPVPLWMADRRQELAAADWELLYFTTETPDEAARLTQAYRDAAPCPLPAFTRGRYLQPVE